MKHRTLLTYYFVIALSTCVAISSQAATLSVDFEGDDGDPNSITEAGFVSLTGADAEPVGTTLSTSETGINITIGATGTAGFLAGRDGSSNDRGGDLSNLTLNDLHGDVIAVRGGDGGMTVQITGLAVNDVVTLTAFHNDANGFNSGFATPGAVVTPSIVSGAALIGSDTGAHSNLSRPGTNTFSGPYEDSDLDPSTISFTATSSTVDLLLQTAAGGNNFLPVSGVIVEVIPEPASFALLGLATACMVIYRRK